MATPVREYIPSLDQQMLERLKYSGIDKDNLSDLVGLFVSLKNKYGLMPISMVAESHPVPNAVTARYIVDFVSLSKLMGILVDTPRLNCVIIHPRGVIKAAQYELAITLGG